MPDERAAFGLQFGHGLGVGLYEFPMISRLHSLDAPAELEVGMVFALETYCPASDGRSAARIEEEVVVTPTGPHVITRFPADELLVARAHLRARRGHCRRQPRARDGLARVSAPWRRGTLDPSSPASTRSLPSGSIEGCCSSAASRIASRASSSAARCTARRTSTPDRRRSRSDVAGVLEGDDRIACTYRGHGHLLAMGTRPDGAHGRAPRPRDRRQRRSRRLDERRRPGARRPRLLRHRRREHRGGDRGRPRVPRLRTRRGRLLRGRRREPGVLLRVPQLREGARAPGRLRVREQPLRRVHAHGGGDRRAASSRARRRSRFRRRPSTAWTSGLFATVASEVVERVRNGTGPELVEAETYRFVGHSRSDPGKYRPEGELDRWKQRDPLVVASTRLHEEYGLVEEELEAVRAEVEQTLDDVERAALSAPFPEQYEQGEFASS